MKTLKKTLCLVLAVVMAVGVLILPASAADEKTTAYTALERYGVLRGVDSNGTAALDKMITRSEVAAIVYRIVTGDTADKNVSNSVAEASRLFPKDKFSWDAGYVGYCGNGGLVKGRGNGSFGPNDNITGYEVLAIVLRAIGYGQNGEFEGAQWKDNTIAKAKELGLTAGVTGDVSKAVNRKDVAQIIYNAVKTPRVEYKFGTYSYTHRDIFDTEHNANITLIDDISVEATHDKTWGDPTGLVHKFEFTWPATNVSNSWTEAPKMYGPYYSAITECDVATDAGITKDKKFTVYTNGIDNKSYLTIEPIDEVHMIGAQGRETKVYYEMYENETDYKTIVFRDTVLAVVTGSHDALYDTAGHLVKAAGSTVTLYANKMMEGYNTPSASNNVIVTFDVDIDQKFDVGTVLSAHIVTAANNTLVKGKITLKDIAVAKTATVTINGIKNNSANEPTGFVGTDGNTYLYAVSYGYNNDAINGVKTTGTPVTLGPRDIGKTYTVYVTDNQDADGNYNVIGIAPQNGTPNYGVVTNVTKVSIGTDENGDTLYAQQLTILKQDNSIDTILYVGNNPTGNKTGNFGTPLKGELISYDTNPENIKYYTVKLALTSGAGVVQTGVADTIANTCVNDKTVFFVEKYVMRNSKDGYYSNGYDIYTGFKTIPTLIDNSKVYDSDNDKLIEHNKMYITYIDVNTDGYAEYVLVRFGTNSSTPPVAGTANNYVYIDYERQQHTTYDDKYTFNAVIDGATVQFVITSDDYDTIVKGGNGLYIYHDLTNGNHGRISRAVNKINGETTPWTYHDGVIEIKAGVTLEDNVKHYYLTVADNAPIHIINPMTGEVSTTTYDLNVISMNEMYADATMWVELNEYGWVDRIYVINDMKDDDSHTKPTVDEYVVGTVTLTLTADAQKALKDTSSTALAFYKNGSTKAETVTTDLLNGTVTIKLTNKDTLIIGGLKPSEYFVLTTDYDKIYLESNASGYAKVNLTDVIKAYVAAKSADKAYGSTIDVTLEVKAASLATKVVYELDGKKVESMTKYVVRSTVVGTETEKVEASYSDPIEVEKVTSTNYTWSTEHYKIDANRKTVVLQPTAIGWSEKDVTVSAKKLTKVEGLTITLHEDTGTSGYVDDTIGEVLNFTAYKGTNGKGNYLFTFTDGRTSKKIYVDKQNFFVTGFGTITKDNGKTVGDAWTDAFSFTSDAIIVDLTKVHPSADVKSIDVPVKLSKGSVASPEQVTSAVVGTSTTGGTGASPSNGGWGNDTATNFSDNPYQALGITYGNVIGNAITVNIDKAVFGAGKASDLAKLQRDNTTSSIKQGVGYVGVHFVAPDGYTIGSISVDGVAKVDDNPSNILNVFIPITEAAKAGAEKLTLLGNQRIPVSYLATNTDGDVIEYEWIVNIVVH